MKSAMINECFYVEMKIIYFDFYHLVSLPVIINTLYQICFLSNLTESFLLAQIVNYLPSSEKTVCGVNEK